MDELFDRALAPGRFRVVLAAFFAAASLGMTLVGIFGVALRHVTGRMRELCVRMALGATPSSVIGLVVVRYVRIAGLGLCAGLALSTAAGRVLAAYLFGVTGSDPATYTTAAILVLVLVGLAGWLPARLVRRARLAEHLAA